MLRADLVPPRNLANNRARRIRLRNNPPLLLSAPAPAPSNPDVNIDTAASIRSVNYIVNHICDPISPNQFASSRSSNQKQCGARGPVTIELKGDSLRRRAGEKKKP